METSIKIIAAVLALTFAKSGSAQVSDLTPSNTLAATANSLATKEKKPVNYGSIDLYGTIPVKNCGWGMGVNVLSQGIKTGDLEMRLGGEFYGTSLERRSIGNVPLEAPQLGNATAHLTNNVYGLNAVARFSLPYSKKIVPYVDVFAGGRFFNTNMNIDPYVQYTNYQNSTSRPLSQMGQWNYGATFGVMASLSKFIKFNVGLMYTYSPSSAQIVDVTNTYLQNGALVTNNMATPNGLFIAKVGFTFLLHSSRRSSNGCGCRGRSSGVWFGGGGRFGGGGFSSPNRVNIGGGGGGGSIGRPRY